MGQHDDQLLMTLAEAVGADAQGKVGLMEFKHAASLVGGSVWVWVGGGRLSPRAGEGLGWVGGGGAVASRLRRCVGAHAAGGVGCCAVLRGSGLGSDGVGAGRPCLGHVFHCLPSLLSSARRSLL